MKLSSQPSGAQPDSYSSVKKPVKKVKSDEYYTPKGVYDCVLDYVKAHTDIENKRIMRPFRPGGDYENEDYTDAVVIDNPPFSFLTRILQFYIKHNVQFFLFAPHLTMASSCMSVQKDVTCIIVGANIVYENGERVITDFVTNMFYNEYIAVSANELRKRLAKLKRKKTVTSTVYPPQYITTRHITIIERTTPVKLKRTSTRIARCFEDKTGIFGAAFKLEDEQEGMKLHDIYENNKCRNGVS